MKRPLLTFTTTLLLALAGCQSTQGPTHLQAIGSTQSVPVNQVEDAAIWIHPTDPAKSLILIANKTRGMELHNVSGTLLKHYDDTRALAGVDVLYNFGLKNKQTDLVIAASPVEGTAVDKNAGVRVWTVDPAKQRITEVTHDKAIHVLDGADPLGIVACHAAGKPTFFVTSEMGTVEQYPLLANSDGSISAQKVRTITFPGKVKGGVADEHAGLVYFADEKTGIYSVAADPAASSTPKLIIPIDQNGMTADLTGITLYAAHDDAGYLIVVSQKPKGESSTLFLFNRAAPYSFVIQIVIDDSSFGGVYSSSGIAVTNIPLSPNFPAGMLAIKNRFNPNATEDYKLFSWSTLAQKAHLLTDPTTSPRD